MTGLVTTTPAWSVALPAPAGELVAAPDGCAAAGAGFVAMVRGTGEVLRSVPTEAGLRRGLAVLPDGRVADVEGDHVVVRRPGGAITARWDGQGVSALAATPDGDLVYVQWSREFGAALVRTRTDGMRLGSVPLAARDFHPPLVTRDLIVVAEGSRVRALDHAGHTRWTATRHQLIPGEPAQPDLPAGAVQAPVVALGDGRFVVEFAEDIGQAPHIVDPRAGTVRRLAARSPVAAVPDGSGRLAALDQHGVVSFSPDGEVYWTHPCPTRPVALLAGTGGQVVAVTAPDQERPEPGVETAVRCLAPDGTPAWTWQPPDPLTATPIVSGGVLYAVATDRLFALPFQGPAVGSGRIRL